MLTVNLGLAWIGDQEVAWRFPLAFQIVFTLIIFGSILNLPESPRWLVMQGRDEDALQVLECLNEKPRDDPFIKNEFDAVKLTVQEMSKGSYRSLFEMSEYREFHRVVLAYVNQMFQQISGINLITYYVSWDSNRYSSTLRVQFLTFALKAPILFKKINLSQNNYPKLLAACNGTEYFLASLIPIFVIELIGRRKLMLVGVSDLFRHAIYTIAHSSLGCWNVAFDGCARSDFVGFR